MFRDERDALSAQVDALEQRLKYTREQLQKTEKELKEAQQGPKTPRSRLATRFFVALFASLFFLFVGYLSGTPPEPTTISTNRTLTWNAQVNAANGPYPAPKTSCQVILNVTHRATPTTLSPKEFIEVTRWQIVCGEDVLTINDQKLTVTYFVEELTTEGTLRYHLSANTRFETSSSFSIDAKSNTARLSRPGYGLLELTVGGPSEPLSDAPLRQAWVPSPP